MDMDVLELHLKLEKMDPSLVPESAVKHKTEMYDKMTAGWAEIDAKAKQTVKDATDVCISSVVKICSLKTLRCFSSGLPCLLLSVLN